MSISNSNWSQRQLHRSTRTFSSRDRRRQRERRNSRAAALTTGNSHWQCSVVCDSRGRLSHSRNAHQPFIHYFRDAGRRVRASFLHNHTLLSRSAAGTKHSILTRPHPESTAQTYRPSSSPHILTNSRFCNCFYRAAPPSTHRTRSAAHARSALASDARTHCITRSSASTPSR